jgi:hypothetical protein
MDFLAKHCEVAGMDKLMSDEVLSRACINSIKIRFGQATSSYPSLLCLTLDNH